MPGSLQPSSARAVRILLVDDRPLIRSGLRVIFDGERDLEVVGEQGDVTGAVAMASSLAPDVVVLHGELGSTTTFLSVQRLATGSSAPAVLLVTGSTDTETTLRAVRAGASGHLSMSAPPEQMLAVLRAVAGGAVVLPPSVRPELARYLLGRLDGAAEAMLATLDERERRLLELLAAGRSNPEMSRELGASLATVKKDLSQVLRKLGVRDRLQAGLYAYQLGLGEPIVTRVPADRSQGRRDPLPDPPAKGGSSTVPSPTR